MSPHAECVRMVEHSPSNSAPSHTSPLRVVVKAATIIMWRTTNRKEWIRQNDRKGWSHDRRSTYALRTVIDDISGGGALPSISHPTEPKIWSTAADERSIIGVRSCGCGPPGE